MAHLRNSLLPILQRGVEHGDRTAVVDATGSATYRDLIRAADQVAAELLRTRPSAGSLIVSSDLEGARIGILIPPSFQFIATLWGIWRAGGIAVPLALSHPTAELAYVLEDCGIRCTVVNRELAPRLQSFVDTSPLTLLDVDDTLAAQRSSDEISTDRPTADEPDLDAGALILYTSGTTGRPKGVVLSHRNIQAQIENLVEAWQWQRDDRILEILPLHHVHGLINIIGCALWSGAVCEILPRFDAERIWQIIRSGRLTLFMAVPTIYVRLIRAWEDASPEDRTELSRAAHEMRLMVSGSAALPIPVLDRWREITGQTLLERYGMTEIGMALSNPYEGVRVAGAVGAPLPGVEVRLVDPDGRPVDEGSSGEIEVRGPTVFNQYWQRPEATRDAFRGSWFCTGDIAIRGDGGYRILGRQSIDIIKCGGEKISALEIEAVLLAHPLIEECAVVGLEDAEWGQRVAAALVIAGRQQLELETLREWAKEHLARFKVPSRIQCLDSLPRNAMGKVTKPAVIKILGDRKDH